MKIKIKSAMLSNATLREVAIAAFTDIGDVMTYYDKLNYFFSFNKSNKLSPATQLIYLHILHTWNCLRCVNSFYLSDSELASSTHLGSKAITDAKRVLKNFGLLDFRVIQGRTKFFLPTGERCVRTEEQISSQCEQTPPSGFITEPSNKYPEIEKRHAGERQEKHSLQENLAKQKAFRASQRDERTPEERERVRELAAQALSRLKGFGSLPESNNLDRAAAAAEKYFAK